MNQNDSESPSADNFLAHFGVRGMKWGYRRERGADGHVEGRPRRIGRRAGQDPVDVSDDFAKAYAAKQKVQKAKGTHVLGNDELKALVERQNLEANYARLNPRKVSAGEKFAKGAGQVLANSAKGAGQQIVQEAIKTAANGQINNAKSRTAAAAAARAARKNFIGPQPYKPTKLKLFQV